MKLTLQRVKVTPPSEFAMTRIFLGNLLLLLTILPHQVYGQSAYCVKKFYESLKKDDASAEIAPRNVEALISEISLSISLGAGRRIKAIACTDEKKAVAYPAKDDILGVPNGNYIIYNPEWIREVIGKDKVQAIAIFGHELGHFLNAHSAAQGAQSIENEREADEFAGCAVARLQGDFAPLQNIIERIRTEKSETYPNRLQSVESARKGFDNCGGNAFKASVKAVLQVAPTPDTVGIIVDKHSAVDYAFKEFKGVGAQIETEDSQWFFLDGSPITPLERSGRILGGSLFVEGSKKITYHNNIHLPPEVANRAKARGDASVRLRHDFNIRDENNNILRIPAILKVFIQ